MVFKRREENGGELDPNINTRGRIKPARMLTNKEIRHNEMMTLLRKFRPHVAKAVMTAVNVMGKEDLAETTKLKAAVIILDNYKQLVGTVYDKDYDEDEGEAISEQSQPVFSLKMINNDEPSESPQHER